MTAEQDLALVSVVFEAEVDLQLLQARSVARYVPVGAVRELVVLDNTRRGLPAEDAAELRRAYGPHAPTLRLLRPADVAHVGGATGWRTQQVLKLMVARRLTSARYVVLDAKNHLVNPWSAAHFLTEDGRMRARTYSYESHPLRDDLEHVLRYLGVDPATHVHRFTATVTPFVLDRAQIDALVDDVERRSGRSFAREFVRQGLTEFFLVAGWLVAQGHDLAQVYDPSLDTGPTLWPHGADAAGLSEVLGLTRHTPFLGVHRRALARLDPGAGVTLAAFWTERGLFGSAAEAEAFLARARTRIEREERRQRRRDLPHRLRNAPRALRRRLARRRASGG